MLKTLFSIARSISRPLGIELIRYPQSEAQPTDLPPDMLKIVQQARPYTLTSLHRLASTQDAVRYVVKNGIQGSLVECGVWRGGNMAVASRTLQLLGDTNRELYLYDTFEGMSEPTEHDADYGGTSAAKLLAAEQKGTGVWCEAGIGDVTQVMKETGYSMDKVHLVKGKVEDTIPTSIPNEIALLRLDTDWYESTLHELVHLYPRLKPGGVLIIDDYGHWRAARQAVDEYFEKNGIRGLLNRVDYTCRSMVKPL
ncbi:MAG: class I SAM-dependent methyltransferase [Verrucomicrobia bacterium]|nr:class I SAM-dependent methyltransferase [Verrucomicrobiota bacterium]